MKKVLIIQRYTYGEVLLGLHKRLINEIVGDHHGQLGLGEKCVGRSYPDPKTWSFNMIIRFVSCGEDHSALVSGNSIICEQSLHNVQIRA